MLFSAGIHSVRVEGVITVKVLKRLIWPRRSYRNRSKEFDLGLSADAWVVVDMQRTSHWAQDDEVNNTEELSVTIAASMGGADPRHKQEQAAQVLAGSR